MTPSEIGGVGILVLIAMTLLTWHMVPTALEFREFNEITMDLQLPLFWKAVLILTGIGAAVVTAFVLLVRDVSQAMGASK